jgi:hypothetical protein
MSGTDLSTTRFTLSDLLIPTASSALLLSEHLLKAAMAQVICVAVPG